MNFSPWFLWFVPDDSFPVSLRSRSASFFCLIVVGGTENRQLSQFLFQLPNSLLQELPLWVPVGSALAPSHKKPGPQLSCRVLRALLHSRIGIIFLKQMQVPPPDIPGRVEIHTSQGARCVEHQQNQWMSTVLKGVVNEQRTNRAEEL